MIERLLLCAISFITLRSGFAHATQLDAGAEDLVMPISAKQDFQPAPVGKQAHKLDKLVRPQQFEDQAGQDPLMSSATTSKDNDLVVVPALAPVDPQTPETLELGDVFGLVARAKRKGIDGNTVVINSDGTLGVQKPNTPGYIFQGIYLEDYNLLLTPEPLATVKLNEHNVFMVNDSLYNPAPMFSVSNWTLKSRTGSTIVCPSWNSVLVHVNSQEKPPCKDAVAVSLGVAALPLP